MIVVYDMLREAPRTLLSLSSAYQRGIDSRDYEVIVVDNGSPKPLESEAVERLGGNFRYFCLEDPPASPAYAVNFGARQARGELLGLMVDGARIVSPGMLRIALTSLEAFCRPVVSTLAFHLGPKVQMESVIEGYNQDVEDRLLASIDWSENGYRLFEIASLAGSSDGGWFQPIRESNGLFMPRELFEELEGFEERFSQPGGGLVNLDFYRRACELPESRLIMLLGEGTFHQIHGGVMTNCPAPRSKRWKLYDEEYRKIRGQPFAPSTRRAMLFGDVPTPALDWIRRSCDLVYSSRPEREPVE